MMTLPWTPALASSVPSGLKATASTRPGSASGSGGTAGSPADQSHTRTVPSPLPLASSLPSGEKATLQTDLV